MHIFNFRSNTEMIHEQNTYDYILRESMSATAISGMNSNYLTNPITDAHGNVQLDRRLNQDSGRDSSHSTYATIDSLSLNSGGYLLPDKQPRISILTNGGYVLPDGQNSRISTSTSGGYVLPDGQNPRISPVTNDGYLIPVSGVEPVESATDTDATDAVTEGGNLYGRKSNIYSEMNI